MSDYRINVRFHADVPAEKKAAEYLQTLNKSRNKFIVDAVIAYMNKESTDNETLLENIRQIFREEVQTVAVVSAPPAAVAVTAELTEEQKAEKRKKCPCGFGNVRLSQDSRFWLKRAFLPHLLCQSGSMHQIKKTV